MQWLSDLKIAIINQDVENIAKISSNFPQNFTNTADLLEARELYEEAIKILKSKKENLGNEIRKLKDIRKYIDA